MKSSCSGYYKNHPSTRAYQLPCFCGQQGLRYGKPSQQRRLALTFCSIHDIDRIFGMPMGSCTPDMLTEAHRSGSSCGIIPPSSSQRRLKIWDRPPGTKPVESRRVADSENAAPAMCRDRQRHREGSQPERQAAQPRRARTTEQRLAARPWPSLSCGPRTCDGSEMQRSGPSCAQLLQFHGQPAARHGQNLAGVRVLPVLGVLVLFVDLLLMDQKLLLQLAWDGLHALDSFRTHSRRHAEPRC